MFGCWCVALGWKEGRIYQARRVIYFGGKKASISEGKGSVEGPGKWRGRGRKRRDAASRWRLGEGIMNAWSGGRSRVGSGTLGERSEMQDTYAGGDCVEGNAIDPTQNSVRRTNDRIAVSYEEI